MRGSILLIASWLIVLSADFGDLRAGTAQTAASGSPRPSVSLQNDVLSKYCVTCHNTRLRTADLLLDRMDVTKVGDEAEAWEKVLRKLNAGMMPPAGSPRPDATTHAALSSWLQNALDEAAAAKPNPGRLPALHRLNRAEYANAVRDLIALEIDAASLLPADDAGYGFDNIADLLGLSPVLLERYMSAARKISRAAVGASAIGPTIETYRVPSDLSQDDHLEGLPFGTRGGTLIRHHFPVDAEYVIRLRLMRTITENIRGLDERHQLDVTVDGESVHAFTIGGKEPPDEEETRPKRDANRLLHADDHLQFRVTVKAGDSQIGVAFVKKNSAQVDEGILRPLLRSFFDPLETRGQPHLSAVTISGPYVPKGAGDTSSRRQIFTCQPASVGEEAACAREIISTLARRAYRRPLTDADLQVLLGFYQTGRGRHGFDAGIEMALRRMLASPEFLFRIERDPPNSPPGSVHRLSDVELASRLSFFIWSSIPDLPLLDLAERGRLKEPSVLEQQVHRMLADKRSQALVSNFAGQWLYLRNLPSTKPDPELFPDWDENLRQALRRETELLFGSVMRENRSALELLNAKHTFLNERLARHYGIPNVYGSHFRRVVVSDYGRGGLLGQGSILTVTSYANRTSPVLRGKWILENILGAPPAPPPPDVPELRERSDGGQILSMRERMVQHRTNPVCASCHQRMDPLGLALEPYDAIGRSRTRSEANGPIDASGALPDGTPFDGPAGLQAALLRHPDQFVTTLTEKLLTYALGRGVEYYDAPAVRTITRKAGAEEYRFRSLILGIVQSAPFQMRRIPS